MGIRQPQPKPYQATESSTTPTRLPRPGFANRRPTQCQRLILHLRKCGDRGCSNVELVTLLKILRYSSRIFECRKAGYVIEAVEKGDGIWVYFLRHEPAVESPPYVFQQLGPTEQDQPKVLVGVTPPLFSTVPGGQ